MLGHFMFEWKPYKRPFLLSKTEEYPRQDHRKERQQRGSRGQPYLRHPNCQKQMQEERRGQRGRRGRGRRQRGSRRRRWRGRWRIGGKEREESRDMWRGGQKFHGALTGASVFLMANVSVMNWPRSKEIFCYRMTAQTQPASKNWRNRLRRHTRWIKLLRDISRLHYRHYRFIAHFHILSLPSATESN